MESNLLIIAKMEKRKILFIMHMPPPVHGAAVVGSHIFNSKIINETFNCKYINLSASKSINEVGKISFKKIVFLFTKTFQIVSEAISFKPDLIYLTPSSDRIGFYRDFFTIKLLRILRYKIVVHFHNKADKKWLSKKYNQILYRNLLYNIEIILLAKQLVDEKASFIKPENLHICPNGMPKTRSNYNEIERNYLTTNILFLSNIIASKGVWVLLEACKIINNKGHNIHCDFIGKWVDIKPQDFEEKVKVLGLEGKVIAHGPVYGKDKNEFFEKANIFAFPTYYHGETFGLVLLEAMEYALPCISTDEGGIASIIKDGETGFIVPVKNPIVLADKIMELIENPELQIRMGNEGLQRYLEFFRLDHFENTFIQILNKCLSK